MSRKKKTIKKIKGYEIRFTGFYDEKENEIWEGDILVGKTDCLHDIASAMGIGYNGSEMPLRSWGLKERDYVKMNRNPSAQYWNWNGHNLSSVAKNIIKVGTIFRDPLLIL